MRLLPEQIAELDPNLEWVIVLRLQLIEEIACGQQASANGGPGREAATKRIDWAVERRERKAEEEAIEDYMRVEVREWWEVFRERQLLTDLYRRGARRRAECGSLDSRRLPSHPEGIRIAKRLLAKVPRSNRFGPEWESEALSEVLAALLLPPIGVPSPGKLREYMERSEVSRAYFDALERLYEKQHNRGETMPRPLFKWQHAPGGRHRRRPARRPLPRHRPLNLAYLLRDLQIQFTIELLRRLGVPSPAAASRQTRGGFPKTP